MPAAGVLPPFFCHFAALFLSFCRGFGLFWRDFSRIFGDFDG